MLEALQPVISWFLSPVGRLVGAVIIFLIIWAIKSVPWVKKKILTTKRRKLLATAIAALLPAIIMLIDSSIKAEEAWSMAMSLFLSAMGIQGGKKALLKKTISISENEEDIQPVVSSKE